jgi:putative ABC transport system permease protein
MFLAVRDLRFARGRFALMGAVVALIAVLGVILSGLAAGLADSGISGLRQLPVTGMAFAGSADGELFTRSMVTESQWKTWAARPGVLDAAPYGNLMANGTIADGAHRGLVLDLAVFGVEPGSFIAPAPTTGAPLSAHGDGILISSGLAAEGLQVGDVLTIGSSGLALPVVGEIGESSYSHVPVAYAPLTVWQRLHYGLPGPLPAAAAEQATAVALRLAPGVSPGAGDAAAGTHTAGKGAMYAATPGYTAESSTMNLIRGFLYAISALVVGAFFTVWTIQRRAELAVLKAIGAGTGYLLRDALAQVLAVLLVATALGTAAGVGLGQMLSGSAPFSLQPAPVSLGAALLVLLGVLGALVAARRVTSVEPLTALGADR